MQINRFNWENPQGLLERTVTNNGERVSFDVPADLIFEILSILPVKSLIRFKSVCKTWHALIEDPNFIEKHKRLQPSQELGYNFNLLVTSGRPRSVKKCRLLHFSEVSHKLIASELPYLSDTHSCIVVGICDGLVCVRLSHYAPKLIICNPTTSQIHQIPPFKFPQEEDDLIFLGFGLLVNGYEIIRIVYTPWEYDIRAELYNTCTNTWRQIKIKLGKGLELVHSVSLFEAPDMHTHGYGYPEPMLIKGVFYWMVQYDYNDRCVAFFDVNKKIFDVIKAPSKAYGQLIEIDRELVLVTHKYPAFDLWAMNKDMRWTIMDRISFCVNPRCEFLCIGRTKVLRSTQNHELVLKYEYNDKLKLLSYHLNTQKIKLLHEVDLEKFVDDVYLYTESLTPINFGKKYTALLDPRRCSV